MKLISTTAVAKSLQMTTKDVFAALVERGLIENSDGNWLLTPEGQSQGGEYKDSDRFGKYIVWPETICAMLSSQPVADVLITSTTIGKHFELSANKMNYILSELGWIKKSLKGWLITEQGKKIGGVQSEDRKSGIPYVRWPEGIVASRSLVDSIAHVKGTAEQPTESDSKQENAVGFREKFEAKHRAADGHFVRSKAEMLIDNWLYMAEIVHAYERKLPIEEEMYCDFYIPTGKVYIEYWGYENDQRYLARKKEKLELYERYAFNLIQLEDKDVQNLDDVLPRLLLKFGVQAY